MISESLRPVELSPERFAETERRLGLSLGEAVRLLLTALNGASPEEDCVCPNRRFDDPDDWHYYVGPFQNFGDIDEYVAHYSYYRDELSVPAWALLLSEGDDVAVFLDLRDRSILLWSIIEGDFPYAYADRQGMHAFPTLDAYLACFHRHDGDRGPGAEDLAGDERRPTIWTRLFDYLARRWERTNYERPR